MSFGFQENKKQIIFAWCLFTLIFQCECRCDSNSLYSCYRIKAVGIVRREIVTMRSIAYFLSSKKKIDCYFQISCISFSSRYRLETTIYRNIPSLSLFLKQCKTGKPGQWLSD